MILVIKGQSAAHHLIHDYTQTPPVHCPAIVVVLKNLRERELMENELVDVRMLGGTQHQYVEKARAMLWATLCCFPASVSLLLKPFSRKQYPRWLRPRSAGKCGVLAAKYRPTPDQAAGRGVPPERGISLESAPLMVSAARNGPKWILKGSFHDV